MILWFCWGFMIVRCAEREWPRAFFNWCTKSWSLKFVFISVKVRIENWANVFPELVSWLLQHQRHVWKLYEWSAPFELAPISPPKSTCSQLKRKLEIEVKAITVCCLWSGSLIWCIVMKFECLKHSLIKPSFEFACYGSLETWEKWKVQTGFHLFLGWF